MDMSRLVLLSLYYFCFASVFISNVLCAGKRDSMEELDPSFFMRTEAFFPDHPFQQFVSGETASVLLGLQNVWKYPVTVFGISGAYYTPDYTQVFRNITQQKTHVKVMPNEQNTFVFKLKPEMEAAQLALVLTIDFTDSSERQWYRAVALNRTIEVVAPVGSIFDLESLFIYFVILALLASSVYMVYGAFFLKSSKRSSKSLLNRLSNAFSSSSALDSSVSGSKSSLYNAGSQSNLKSGTDQGPDTWTALSSEWLPEGHLQRRSVSPKAPQKPSKK
jgi:hypothetical protein